jgi:hypothetical protein
VPVNMQDLERLLIAARPEPPSAFVDALEERLWPPASPRRRRRPRLVFAGAAAATALAGCLLVLGLAGLLPFTAGHTRPAVGGSRCQTVVVERWRRVPVFERARDGSLRLVHRWRQVPQAVRRCR